MAIQIFKGDNCYCVSEDHHWVEGRYLTEEAASIAVNLDALRLHNMWNKNRPKPLTKEDLLTIK